MADATPHPTPPMTPMTPTPSHAHFPTAYVYATPTAEIKSFTARLQDICGRAVNY
ncbi:MAG: hypothetical protein HDS65_03705 [Bacteroidales bacterium]|nr:hypothetical protein [Bacteroidales bacterium]